MWAANMSAFMFMEISLGKLHFFKVKQKKALVYKQLLFGEGEWYKAFQSPSFWISLLNVVQILEYLKLNL